MATSSSTPISTTLTDVTQRCHEQLQHRVAAAITALAQLHQQHTRRYPFRRRRAQPLGDLGPERVELGCPRRTRLVACRRLVAQIAPHRVARDPRFPRDLANTLAVPMQYPDLQSHLYSHHPAPSVRENQPSQWVSFQAATGVRITAALTPFPRPGPDGRQ